MNFGFAHPWVLLLLLLIPAYWWFTRRSRPVALVFSRAALLGRFAPRAARLLARVPNGLRAVAFAAAVMGPVLGRVVLLASAHGGAYIAGTGLLQTPPNSMPCRAKRLEARCGGVYTFGTGILVDTSSANLNKAARVR